jgi:ABC-type dipeptide/oligopeptide/nickel transport system permease subunit
MFGLGMGIIGDNVNKINSLKNFLIKFFKYFCDILSEFFQSIPLLIVLIISVLMFQLFVDDPQIRFQYTVYVLAIFSTPKLSFQIDGIIKRLKKEEFLLAAKASGISKASLIFKHILYYESKGVIMIQMINFFLFTMMMEIFLTYFGKGSTLAQSSLGSLVFKSADSISIIAHLSNNGMHQHVLLTIVPFIFIILLCITIRWLGNRILILTDTK